MAPGSTLGIWAFYVGVTCERRGSSASSASPCCPEGLRPATLGSVGTAWLACHPKMYVEMFKAATARPPSNRGKGAGRYFRLVARAAMCSGALRRDPKALLGRQLRDAAAWHGHDLTCSNGRRQPCPMKSRMHKCQLASKPTPAISAIAQGAAPTSSRLSGHPQRLPPIAIPPLPELRPCSFAGLRDEDRNASLKSAFVERRGVSRDRIALTVA